MKMIMLVAAAGAAPLFASSVRPMTAAAQAAPCARALETGLVRKCLDSDLALGATSEAAYYSGRWSAPASR